MRNAREEKARQFSWDSNFSDKESSVIHDMFLYSKYIFFIRFDIDTNALTIINIQISGIKCAINVILKYCICAILMSWHIDLLQTFWKKENVNNSIFDCILFHLFLSRRKFEVFLLSRAFPQKNMQTNVKHDSQVKFNLFCSFHVSIFNQQIE